MDRTEEIKALRAFVKERGLGKNWLGKTVRKLRAGKTFSDLTQHQLGLLWLLSDFGQAIVIPPRFGCEIGRVIMPAYEIQRSYTLPLLETPPRFKKGAWLWIKPREELRQVISRKEFPSDVNKLFPLDDWCAVIDLDGAIGFVGGEECKVNGGWDRYQELPPMPDKARLAEQGYELTMEVADCSVEGHGHLWASHNLFDVYDRKSGYGVFNGWRWLVRKIEKKEEPTTCTISFPVTVTFGEPVVAATEKPEMFGIGTAIELLKAGRKVKRAGWCSHLIIFPSHPSIIYVRGGESQWEWEPDGLDTLVADWIEYTE